MALTPEQLAELQRLKQMYAPLVEAQRRRDQADANAQKMGIPLAPPMDKKAKGGFVNEAHRKWFGDSKVVDEKGHPLVVYHGTPHKEFTEFDPKKSFRGLGFQFTTHKNLAQSYATKDGRVIGAHLKLERPYIEDVTKRAAEEDAMKSEDELSGGDYYPDTAIDWFHKYGRNEIKHAMSTGNYDGYIIYEDGLPAIYGVLKPHQIKLAHGNRGTYDPNNPDITKATGGSIPSMDVMRLAIGGQGPKNWLKGSVERVLRPLVASQQAIDPENLEPMQRQAQEEGPLQERAKRRLVEHYHANSINQWIERNLANYIKKQMATPDDPIRKLAEQGIVHMPTEQVGLNRYKAADRRRQLGEEQLGQSEEAKAWEDATDVAFHRTNVGNIMGHPDARKRNGEPWMEKADPKTHLYYPSDSMHAHYLGFDHLVDVLKEDLAEGRIRPEQLSKVSIEHAVRRAHEYDQEKKRKMAETALKATEGMPVHKDYGDGFKWIELAMPKELPEGWSQMEGHPGIFIDPEGKNTIHNPNKLRLEDALKYEGDTMGHCVGGYCPDVAEGKTRIFSLRDAKNEPHVTIEVKPDAVQKAIHNLPKNEREALWQEVKDQHFEGQMPGVRDEDQFWDLVDQHYVAKYGFPAPRIKQIKGKGNAKPKKDYIPYVQDFVKSGNWSDVGDAQNAELRHAKDVFNEAEQSALKKRGVEIPSHGYLTGDQIQQMHNAITPEGKRLKYDSAGKIVGGDAGSGFNDGGEVDAEEVFMGKGGKVKELEQYLRDREGEYGLKRLQRAADEIPGLENMYTLDALKRAFGGDNAKALMTMNPADFEKFAVRLFPDPDTREEEMEERIEHVRGLPPMNHHEYIEHLAKIKGGFADVPFLEVDKRPEYLPNISGHEGRHRSRAMMVKGAQKSLVQLFPTGRMREPMPRRHREDFIEAMKKELGEKRLVTGEGRSLLPADLEAPEHKNIERRNMLGGRPQLPEIYKDGGEVDAESYFFPNKE